MTTADRATERLAWLRHTLGDDSVTLESASADASFRSYWRTEYDGQSYVLMDAPPGREDPRPWIAIGERLAAAGIHVPRVYASDLDRGFLLIEDLGKQLYQPALDDDSADRLYGDAMDALLRMQTRMASDDLPPFDRAVIMQGLEVMPEWFLSRHLGQAPDAGERRTLDEAFGLIADAMLEQPRRFVHRDFHSRNLLVTARDNPGVIDFQGALAGPVTYDLASLLRDAYVAWPRERVEGWAESYRRRLHEAGVIGSDVDAARFLRWFDFTGLQRHTRVLGQFYRLWYRDGKPGYLADVPRIHRYIASVAASYPELAGFTALLERRVAGRDLTAVTA